MQNLRSQTGLALVVSLLLMLTLVLIGAGLAISSRGGVNVSTSFRNQQSAFEAAMAGLEHGREAIRARQFTESQAPAPTPTPVGGADRFTAVLTLAADGGTLVDPVDLANFNISGATTNGFAGTPNRPVLSGSGTPIVSGGIVATGGSAYQTFITNDAAEGTSTTDANQTITLTAFGSDAASRGFSVVQGVFAPRDVPDIHMDPGIVMPGPAVNFNSGSSAAQNFDGDGGTPVCFPSVAVTTTAARDQVQAAILGPPNRANRYTTCNPAGGAPLNATTGSIENILNSADWGLPNPYDDPADGTLPPHDTTLQQPCPGGSTDPRCSGDPFYITSVAYYTHPTTGIRARYEAAADFLLGPAGGTGTGTFTLDSTNLGSTGAPRITVVSGSNITLAPGEYGGVLVITLNSTTTPVTVHGNFSFTGNIYVLGDANVLRNGGGSGVYCGGMAIANTNAPAAYPPGGIRVGTPTFAVTGGGAHFNGPLTNSPGGVTNCNAATDPNYTQWGNPLNRLSFQQLR